MLQKLTAKLYLDNKEKWRVKFDTSNPHEKGDIVPLGICTAFHKVEHDQKSCGVTKKDGTITCVQIGEKIFSDISSYPGAQKKVQGQSILSQQLHPSFSSTHTTTSAINSKSSSKGPDAIEYNKTCSQVAWQCAVKGAMLGKDYKNSAKSLPMMIRHNGLVASLVYIGKQKKEMTHYRMLFMHLSGWLVTLEPDLAQGEIVENFRTKVNSARTRVLTIEVNTFLAWLSRYAEGLTIQNNSEKHG